MVRKFYVKIYSMIFVIELNVSRNQNIKRNEKDENESNFRKFLSLFFRASDVCQKVWKYFLVGVNCNQF